MQRLNCYAVASRLYAQIYVYSQYVIQFIMSTKNKPMKPPELPKAAVSHPSLSLPPLPAHLLHKPTVVESDKSVSKLNQLGFDPIQRLVILHDNIDREINSMLYDEDGEPKKKFSQVAYATLLGIQAKISNDLMRYGYARVREAADVNVANPEPIRIILNRVASSEKAEYTSKAAYAPKAGYD